MLRRAFFSRLPAVPAFFTGSQSAAAAPARHAQDEWLDERPKKHRAVFDTWMADRFGLTLGFVQNWIRLNREAYELTDDDLAVVIVARHGTTPFAFNEAMWTKYGSIFAANMSAHDKTANPSANAFAVRLTSLSQGCLRLAICNLTTRAYAQIIARETGVEQAAVYKELTANAIERAQFVAAGILAVTRAQERGYSLVSIG
jgi:hypothetical protein